jgi:4-hydroxy-4-methyl-2-oxoglutarate aldolase
MIGSTEVKSAIEELKKLPGPLVSVLYDTLSGNPEGEKRRRVMSPDIKLVSREDCRLIGTAYTVRTKYLSMNMLEAPGEGDVLVIDGSSATGRIVFGQITAMSCRAKGISGVVIDGGTRDVLEIREVGYPVFARYITPLHAPISLVGAELNVPISCGGVLVNPGDLVVGDIDGVLVVPPELIPDLAEGAKYVAEIEELFARRIKEEGIYYEDLPEIKDMWKLKENLQEPEWKLYQRWLEKYNK